MTAQPEFIAAQAHVDDAAIHPLPRSRKEYVQGSRPDLRVPMRVVEQSATPASFGAEPNPPVWVYDTSGPYTDPRASIDIRKGLPALRAGRGRVGRWPGATAARRIRILPGPRRPRDIFLAVYR